MTITNLQLYVMLSLVSYSCIDFFLQNTLGCQLTVGIEIAKSEPSSQEVLWYTPLTFCIFNHMWTEQKFQLVVLNEAN